MSGASTRSEMAMLRGACLEMTWGGSLGQRVPTLVELPV